MALNKLLVPVNFGAGIDTKIDKKQQIFGTFRRAKNVVFETINMARKRNGYDRKVLSLTDHTYIENADRLAKFKNELEVLADNRLYAYSESLNKYLDKGAIHSVYPESTPVLNNSHNHRNVDVIHVNGLSVFVSVDTSDNTARYSVQDNESKSLLVNNVQFSAAETVTQVRVAAISNVIYVLYGTSAGDIKRKYFDINQPTVLSSVLTVANNFDPTPGSIDTLSTDTRIYVAYGSTVVGAYIRVVSIDNDGSIGSGLGISGSAQATCIDLVADESGRLLLSWGDATSVNFCVIAANLLSLVIASTVIETINDVCNVTAKQIDGVHYFYYEISAAATYNHLIRQNTASSVGVVETASNFIRSLGLASKQFLFNGTKFLLCTFETPLQSTYFLLDENAVVVAKISGELGGGLVTAVLPHSVFVNDTDLLLATLVKGKNVSDNGTFFSLLGVNSTIIDFQPDNSYYNAELGDNLHIAGGLLQMYDGQNAVEHGFNMYPEIITAGTTGTTTGFMSNGNYGYIALYKWTDNYGQEHRSVPSIGIEATLSGGGSTQFQNIIVPTLRVTAKSDVVIELYRTEDNGSIYYLCSSTTTPTANNKTTDTVTIKATISDADLISREVLYTTGGVLENTQCPAAKHIAVHTASDRIFAVVGRSLLQYSKIRNDGFPVEWNDSLLITTDPIGGAVTATAAMDEKQVIFCADGIFYVSGDGPNNLGEQNTFVKPERVSTEIGCTEPSSIVLIQQGLLFKSRKGIYLLTRSMSLDYIGDRVEEYNNLSITSAKVVGKQNQVRFTTSDGDCLVYNYQLNKWCTFDNHRGLSAETIGDDYYYLRTDGELFQENPTSFSDNGSAISMSLETGWMSMAQLQGFMRVYQAMLLAEYKSPHLLKMEAGYNFNEAWTQSKTIDPADFLDISLYGEDSPYGSGTPYGGNGTVYQARFAFKQQKVQSIKLRISDVQSTAGEGLSLSAITMECGGKSGLFKPGLGQKFGVS